MQMSAASIITAPISAGEASAGIACIANPAQSPKAVAAASNAPGSIPMASHAGPAAAIKASPAAAIPPPSCIAAAKASMPPCIAPIKAAGSAPTASVNSGGNSGGGVGNIVISIYLLICINRLSNLYKQNLLILFIRLIQTLAHHFASRKISYIYFFSLAL
jgi:hypothetical protein